MESSGTPRRWLSSMFAAVHARAPVLLLSVKHTVFACWTFRHTDMPNQPVPLPSSRIDTSLACKPTLALFASNQAAKTCRGVA